MKFDFVIGNPPYQDETTGDNKEFAPPVYHKFIESAYQVSNVVEMIHPARFLFNAGSTPKSWNEQMLHDPHMKVIFYEHDSSRIFTNTDIKGGVAVTYRDAMKNYGAIGTFTQYNELNSIMKKVFLVTTSNIKDIIFIQNKFNLSVLYEDFPECSKSIGSNGRDNRFEKNIFEKIPVFSDELQNEDDIKVLGIFKNKRTYKYISKKYVDLNHENLNKYKVILPVSNGRGMLGETLSTPVVGKPMEAYTRSFIGIGSFDMESEAIATLNYIKSKFARTMLGVLKITQMNNKDVWGYVPLENFTNKSDIDWTVSVKQIDKQLYKKYNLTDDEIKFIESHVKEME